ncbi:MAG: M23 family metallopeptidase [Desulforhopalus sp.]|nr:M23 family metallopeptidase [Desulforhopalus sp.]
MGIAKEPDRVERIFLLLLAAIMSAICIAASLAQSAEIIYVFPVRPIDRSAFSPGGHAYPGIDIFGKKDSTFVAPVSGVIEDVQREDEWDKAELSSLSAQTKRMPLRYKKAGGPEMKGGRWVSLLGDDGFRYYGSHLQGVAHGLNIGSRVQAGDVLGYLGNSGNAKDTPIHLHFGISSASTPYSWQTRRGEIEPYPFLTCIIKKGCNPGKMLHR